MASKSLEVNTLNVFLIVISLALAYKFPFELFILAYAILGPLHYVTEINWLEKKNFFIKDIKQVWVLIGLAVLISIPFALASYPTIAEYFPKGSFVMNLREQSAIFAFVAILTAISLTLTRKWWIILLVVATTYGIGLLLNGYRGYAIVLGGLLPTIIHVFIFTFFFMLYGAMKDKSKIGYFSSFLLLVIPVVIFLIPIDVRGMAIEGYFKEAFDTSKFGNLNYALAWSIGIFEEHPNYVMISEIGVKLQVFIAFAYTYHYLNWFSKTTVIGWHKVISKPKLLVLLSIWILALIVYYVNYYMGFILLLFLSYLHVMLEFPLNWVSVKEVVKKVFVRS